MCCHGLESSLRRRFLREVWQVPAPAPNFSGSLQTSSRVAIDAMKTFEDVIAFFVRNAHPGVTHSQFNRAVYTPERKRDLALEGKFEGVRQQVQHDLFPHVAVDVNGLTQRFAVN